MLAKFVISVFVLVFTFLYIAIGYSLNSFNPFEWSTCAREIHIFVSSVITICMWIHKDIMDS